MAAPPASPADAPRGSARASFHPRCDTTANGWSTKDIDPCRGAFGAPERGQQGITAVSSRQSWFGVDQRRRLPAAAFTKACRPWHARGQGFKSPQLHPRSEALSAVDRLRIARLGQQIGSNLFRHGPIRSSGAAGRGRVPSVPSPGRPWAHRAAGGSVIRDEGPDRLGRSQTVQVASVRIAVPQVTPDRRGRRYTFIYRGVHTH